MTLLKRWTNGTIYIGRDLRSPNSYHAFLGWNDITVITGRPVPECEYRFADIIEITWWRGRLGFHHWHMPWRKFSGIA